MSIVKFNLRDLNPDSTLEIYSSALADILLGNNSEVQADVLIRFFSLLPFDNVLEISKEIGKNDRAYHGLKNLFEHTDKERKKIAKERLEYEQSEQSKRDKAYNDCFFKHSPDGRP